MTGIIEYFVNLITDFIDRLGYSAIVFLMALESACVPIPSEVIMPFSGYLVWTGRFDIYLVTLAGALGSLLGSLLAYYAGLYLGREFVLRYGRYLLLTRKHLDWAEEWFRKYGELAAFFSRMMPIVRTFISLPAGVGKMNVVRFSAYTFLGSLPWCYLLARIGLMLGPHWRSILEFTRKIDYLVIAALVVIIVIYVLWKRVGTRHKTHDMRRRTRNS